MVDKIKELCKLKKIPISKLEKQAGLGNGTIGKWEKFGRKPKYESLKSIADVLGVPLSALTGEKQKEKPPHEAEAISKARKELLDFVYDMNEEDAERALLILKTSVKLGRDDG